MWGPLGWLAPRHPRPHGAAASPGPHMGIRSPASAYLPRGPQGLLQAGGALGEQGQRRDERLGRERTARPSRVGHAGSREGSGHGTEGWGVAGGRGLGPHLPSSWASSVVGTRGSRRERGNRTVVSGPSMGRPGSEVLRLGAAGTREAGGHRGPAGPLRRSLLWVLGVPPSPVLG